jgi:hypothetical protein
MARPGIRRWDEAEVMNHNPDPVSRGRRLTLILRRHWQRCSPDWCGRASSPQMPKTRQHAVHGCTLRGPFTAHFRGPLLGATRKDNRTRAQRAESWGERIQQKAVGPLQSHPAAGQPQTRVDGFTG